MLLSQLMPFRRRRARSDVEQALKATVDHLRKSAVERKGLLQQAQDTLRTMKARAVVVQQDVERLRLRWKRERVAREGTAARLAGLERKLASRERSLTVPQQKNERLRAAVPSWALVRRSLPARVVSTHARAAQADLLLFNS